MGNVLVVHSTEGSTIDGAVATMRRNRSESNWVADPDTGEVVTLKPTVGGDRSLRNLPGGVETNNRPGVWQLEVVAFATDIPHMPEYWFRRLGAIVSSLCEAHDIPKRFPYPFRPYPASYGLRAPQRLAPAQWLAVEGIVGHQHVPENTHGDPGDISRVIPYVTTPTPEDDMKMDNIAWLDTAMRTVERIYARRGRVGEAHLWHDDILGKLRRGEDIARTITWIDEELARQAAGK